jgi:hypothetical protein
MQLCRPSLLLYRATPGLALLAEGGKTKQGERSKKTKQGRA